MAKKQKTMSAPAQAKRITTTAKTDEECKALLAGFRFPFKN